MNAARMIMKGCMVLGTVALGVSTVWAGNVTVVTLDDLKAAIASDEREEGDVITIADGTYEITESIVINKPIVVQGTSREGTILTRAASKATTKFSNITMSGGATLKNMTVEKGYTTSSGCNILIADGTVENCIVQNGKGTGNGCGGTAIAAYDANNKGTVTIRNCVVRNNTATVSQQDHSGAAIWCEKTVVLVENCVFYGNVSYGQVNSFVGAPSLTVYQNARGVTIKNCTFADSFGMGGGAIYSNKNTTKVQDCLFYHNQAWRNDEKQKDIYGTFASVDHCAFDRKTTAVTCTDCVEGEMYFVDAANGDYTPLSYANVAVGAGTDGCDIGALPHKEVTEPECSFKCDVTAAKAASFTATFTAVCGGVDGAPTYTWDFGDGTEETTDSATISHLYTEVGTYTPKLQVSGMSDWFEGAPIAVAPTEVVVGTATELTDALAAAGDGTVITVMPGDYEFSSGTTLSYFSVGDTALIVQKGVKIRGATGNPDDVVFYVKGNTHANKTTTSRKQLRLAMLDHPDAELSSIALRFASVNGVRYFGAGCFVDYHGGTVSNCSFTGCSTFNNAGGGSAVGVYGGLVTHCIITNNYSWLQQSTGEGGGAVVALGKGVIRNSLIAGNTGTANADKTGVGAAGVVIYGNAVLESCTIAGNTGKGQGGVYQAANTATIRNCVIQDNDASDTDYDQFQPKDATGIQKFINCASTVAFTFGVKSGVNCQTGKLPVENKEAGDWRPAYGSVALENGLVQDWMYGAKALNGENRLSDDEKVDIGAYQYKKSSVNGSFTPLPTEGAVDLSVGFTASVQSDAGAIDSYVWDFGDGSETLVTTEPVAAHTYTVIGSYVPTLKAVIGGKEYSIAYAGAILAGPSVMYVTCESKTEDGAYPYGSWEQATTNLQTALDAAVTGSRIVLRRGVHTNNYEALIEKDITIEGETDNPADVEVVRQIADKSVKGRYRTFCVGSPKAVLRNLTISGGAIYGNTSTFGADLLIQGAGGTVSNCIITAGYIGPTPVRHDGDPNNSCGAGAALQGGLLTHCIISNNIVRVASNDNGNGGGAVRLSGGRMEYCLVTCNRVDDSELGSGDAYVGHYSAAVRLSGGTMANCTIVSNDVTRGWGIAGADGGVGTVVNCLSAANVSINPDSDFASVCSPGIAAIASHCAGDRETGAAGFLFAEDLKFVDPENGDWRIHCNSVAAKNADASVITATRDLVGEPTIYLRDKADIGCYTRADKPGMLILMR